MKWPRLSIRLILACTATLFVISVPCCVAIVGWRPEPILHILGMVSANEGKIIHELSAFRQLVKMVANYSVDTKQSMPPERLADYFTVQFPDKDQVFGRNNRTLFRYLESGIDPWGSEFVFKSVVVHREENRHTLYLTIRSIGANGIDEDGKGDDWQRVIEYPFYLEPPPWTPHANR
jgi:hypothetical protein